MKPTTRKIRLSDSNVASLPSNVREYFVWDTQIPGLGVRVRPSGLRAYVYRFRSDGAPRRQTLGSAAALSVNDARRRCHEIELEADTAKPGTMDRATRPPRLAEFIAGEWKTACYDRYRPSSRKGIDSRLSRQLLPTFGKLRLDQIVAIDVNRWFDRYSVTAPGGANHALGLLRQIFNQAILRGHVQSNPTRGIKMNPQRKVTRFLSRAEVARLHDTLDRCVAERPSHQPAADVIRLLLLTGCRRAEITDLKWQEVSDDSLHLTDAKTGPRRVFLNEQAQDIVHRQRRTRSPFVFPSKRDPARPIYKGLPLWRLVRKRAGFEDVRLHDLRHTFASYAVMQGIPLPTVARLLGHRQVRMTLRYAHVHDVEVEAAAERIGEAITQICAFPSASLQAIGRLRVP